MLKATVAAIALLPITAQSLIASPLPAQFPVVPEERIAEMPCYMQKDGQTFDLEALCKGLSVFPGTAYSGNPEALSGIGGSNVGGGSGSSGPCETASQRDSKGRLCGERAADRRPGG